MLGEVIHGYRIDRALAADKGGFGDVFFATHVDSGAEAVVKVLKAEMSAHRDIVTRFFNEARAAASIHHPGIVQIHNVGYHGDRAYLLMERLRGEDLETRVQGGPLPVERALVFMRQAAGAIGAAHDRGIVHRDLKPANLFVVADPDVVGGERVKVLDFGIAKLTVDAGAGKTQGVFGTPSYMSPEQCASTGAVDARADLYSLGCIFYELVCGRPPFGHGGLELIASHLRDTPQPPRALAPWLPAPVEHVILQLLEKQPERRYPSCAALIAALDHAAATSGMRGTSSPYVPAGSGTPAAPSFSPRAVPAASHGMVTRAAPASTTLGSSTGAVFHPPRKRGLALWLGAGVTVAGAIVAIVVLASRGGQPGGRTPASMDAGLAITTTEDAAQLAAVAADARPAVTADAKSVATADAKPAVTSDTRPVVASEAKPVVTSDAKPVVTADAKPVVTSDAKPVVTSEAKPTVTRDSKPAVASVPRRSVAPAHKPAAAIIPTSSEPGGVPAAPRNGCEPRHVDDLIAQAENQYRAGYPRPALALMRKALSCRQDVRMHRLALMYACDAKDPDAARQYFPKVPPQFQPALEQKCQQQGIVFRP